MEPNKPLQKLEKKQREANQALRKNQKMKDGGALELSCDAIAEVLGTCPIDIEGWCPVELYGDQCQDDFTGCWMRCFIEQANTKETK